MSRKLSNIRKETRYNTDKNDELFNNGIFKFDISSLLNDLYADLLKPEIKKVSIDVLKEMSCDFQKLIPEYVENADISRPVLLLEIAPDYREYIPDIKESDYITRGYVLADGNHRVCKACKVGITELSAYLIRMEDHTKYMLEHYEEYADYWNLKLKERERDSRQRK